MLGKKSTQLLLIIASLFSVSALASPLVPIKTITVKVYRSQGSAPSSSQHMYYWFGALKSNVQAMPNGVKRSVNSYGLLGTTTLYAPTGQKTVHFTYTYNSNECCAGSMNITISPVAKTVKVTADGYNNYYRPDCFGNYGDRNDCLPAGNQFTTTYKDNPTDNSATVEIHFAADAKPHSSAL
ncbi:MAG: hypothetical protein K0U12_01250 [Gammaproteobacteria bacterium]|nr:hypothetical protein [Gammaproteobacteria bacterium]